MFFSEIGPDFFGLLVGVFGEEDIVVVGVGAVNAGVGSKGLVFEGEGVRIVFLISVSLLLDEFDFIF